MEIIEQRKDDILILELTGSIDPNTSPVLQKKVLDFIGSNEKKIILDFTNVEYISSAGLRVMLMAAKSMKKSGGQIILSSMKDFVKEVFDMSGFSTIFKIVNTTDEAVSEI